MWKKVAMLKMISNKFFAIAHDDMILSLEDDENDDIKCRPWCVVIFDIYIIDSIDEIDEMQFLIFDVLVFELDDKLEIIELFFNIREKIDEFDIIVDDDDDDEQQDETQKIDVLEID